MLVTRARAQAGELASKLEARGASPILAPAIEILPAPLGPLNVALRLLMEGGFAWIVFTSRSGVEALFERLEDRGAAGSGLPARVAAVGEGTAAALRERGVRPHLVPAVFTTEALGRAMPRGSGRVLLARADIAPAGVEAALEAKGWTPIRVPAYRTRPVRRLPAPAARAIREGRLDAVTFASASAVGGFVGAAGEVLAEASRRPRVICIGPVTALQARAAGLRVDSVARPHTIDGLVAAVEHALAPGGRRRETGRGP